MIVTQPTTRRINTACKSIETTERWKTEMSTLQRKKKWRKKTVRFDEKKEKRDVTYVECQALLIYSLAYEKSPKARRRTLCDEIFSFASNVHIDDVQCIRQRIFSVWLVFVLVHQNCGLLLELTQKYVFIYSLEKMAKWSSLWSIVIRLCDGGTMKKKQQHKTIPQKMTKRIGEKILWSD